MSYCIRINGIPLFIHRDSPTSIVAQQNRLWSKHGWVTTGYTPHKWWDVATCPRPSLKYTMLLKEACRPWFNIKMMSYQYRKSHCGDKTVVRSSYLHNGISYTGKMTSLYWIGALCVIVQNKKSWLICTGIHIVKIRSSRNRLIFKMEISILSMTVFLLEPVPGPVSI